MSWRQRELEPLQPLPYHRERRPHHQPRSRPPADPPPARYHLSASELEQTRAALAFRPQTPAQKRDEKTYERWAINAAQAEARAVLQAELDAEEAKRARIAKLAHDALVDAHRFRQLLGKDDKS